MGTLQIIGIVFLILLSLLFYFRSKIMEVLTKSLSVIFILLIITTIAGLFFGSVFTKMSDSTLQSVGIYKAIVTIDEKIPVSQLTDTATDIFDDFWKLFEQPHGSTGSPQEDDIISDYEQKGDRGLLEANLYPVLVNLIAIIYRVFVTVLSLVGMIFVTYLNYNTSEIARLKGLEKRVRELESLFKTK